MGAPGLVDLDGQPGSGLDEVPGARRPDAAKPDKSQVHARAKLSEAIPAE